MHSLLAPTSSKPLLHLPYGPGTQCGMTSTSKDSFPVSWLPKSGIRGLMNECMNTAEHLLWASFSKSEKTIHHAASWSLGHSALVPTPSQWK